MLPTMMLNIVNFRTAFFFFFFNHVANQTRIILLTTKRVNIKNSIEHACKSLLMYRGSGQEWINTAYNLH